MAIRPSNFFREIDDNSDFYNVTENFKSYIKRDPLCRSELFKIDCIFCKKCGGYKKCSKGGKGAYCSCSDVWGERCREIEKEKQEHQILVRRQNFNVVLDELEEKVAIYDPSEDPCTVLLPRLEPSRYDHEGPCLPNKRACKRGCWKYLCVCGSGFQGYGYCNYKRCKEGKKKRKM